MHRASLFLLAFAFLFVFQARVSAQPEVEVLLTAEKITIEETLQMIVEASWARSEASYQFLIPQWQFENLELLKQGESQEFFVQNGERWVRKRFILTLAPLEKAPARIQAFRLNYIDPAAQKGGHFQSPDYSIQVTGPPFRLSAWHAAAAGFVLLGTGGFLFWRRRKRAETVEAAAHPVTRAVEDLKTLSAAGGIGEACKLFKKALIEQYQLPGVSAADREILGALQERGLPKKEIDQIRSLLERISRAKFAPASGSGDETLCRDLTRFIESKQAVC